MRGKTGSFIFLTLALIFIAAFCAARTVTGQEASASAERESSYREQEAELLADTRAYLTDNGFCDSGVTLSRSVEGQGHRIYTFTIHHSRIDRMPEEERRGLGERLTRLSDNFVCMSPGETCSFRYRFLVPDGEK